MAQVKHTIEVRIDPSGLLSRIERLADHVANAPDDDPVKILACEIGEINADTDLKQSLERNGEVLVVTIQEQGNLAKILAAFEAHL